MEASAALTAGTTTHRLANGMTLVVSESHASPVVSIVTYVKAGYFDESDDQVGVSHVLEHMYFKGTARRGVGEMARETKLAGGYLNAGTIYDHTSYYTVLPSSSFELGLDIQSDALLNSVIDAEELRRELQVIIQEAKRKRDNPAAVATESLYEVLFERHRMRRWRIGTEEGLARLTRDDVWGFYRAHYRPRNVVLVVAGDVHAAPVVDRVESLYGAWSGDPEPFDRGPAEPAAERLRVRDMHGPIVQSHLELGWRTPASLHEDTPLVDLLAVALGQGRASRLFREVRERGLVSGISADNYTPTELGVFGVGAELAPEDTDRALDAVLRSVARVREEPIAADELERARNIIDARRVKRLETVEGRANLLAEWQSLGDWRLVESYERRIRAATPADLQRVAERYLDPDGLAVLVYRPKDSAPPNLRAETIRATLQSAPAAAAPASAAARTSHAAHRAVECLRIEDGVHFYAHPSGGTIVVKPRHSAPLVTLAIAARGGSLDEAAQSAGVTGLMMRASVKGTQSRTAAQLAEATESLGGAISAAAGSDMLHWNLSVPSRHLEPAVELLADAALHPTFPETELETERKIILSDLDRVRDDMYQYPLQLLFHAAFAGHPYGFSLEQMREAIASHTRERVAAWHAQRLARGGITAFVVGDVDADDAARVVAGALDSLPPTRFDAAARRAAWPRTAAAVVETREKAQSAIALGFPGPDRNDPDSYTLQVLANAVSGLGGRFFDELRDKRSLAYTVAAFPVSRWMGGAFVSYIATSPEREAEARETLLAELERLRTEGVEEADLERSRRYTLGAWQIRQQTNGAQLSELAVALLLGSGLAEIREFEACVRGVTADKVIAAARRYFDVTRLVEAAVRGGNPS